MTSSVISNCNAAIALYECALISIKHLVKVFIIVRLVTCCFRNKAQCLIFRLQSQVPSSSWNNWSRYGNNMPKRSSFQCSTRNSCDYAACTSIFNVGFSWFII